MINSKFKILSLTILLTYCTALVQAGNPDFVFNPTVSFNAIDDEGKETHIDFDLNGGEQNSQAPLEVKFKAGVNPRTWTIKYLRWTITHLKDGVKQDEIMRDVEDFSLTLSTYGQYQITLEVIFSKEGELDETCTAGIESPMVINIGNSALNFPSAFSPNGDEINDYLKPTKIKSIIKLEGYVINRWGKVLHTFNLQNVQQGWDGRVGGNYVKDGAYLLYINAYGSDGRHYEIKKAINVLKGFKEDNDSTT